MSFEVRSMSVSEILDTGFALVRSRLRDLAGIGFIVYLPFAVLSAAVALLVGPEAERLAATDAGELATALPAVLAIGGVSLLAYALGFPLIVAAVTVLVGGVYLGREVSLTDALRTGLRRYLPVLMTFLLFALMSMASILSAALALGTLVGFVSSALGAPAAFAIGLLGFAAVVVLYVYLSSAFAVILQVVVFEGTSGLRAIYRAFALTDGMRLRTLAVIFVATLVVLFPAVMVELFFGGIPVVGVFLVSAVQALGFAYTSCTEVVLYFDLRCRKEAFDLEYLAQLVGER